MNLQTKFRSRDQEPSQLFTPAYGLKVLRTESFRTEPLATVWRSFVWLACHIGPKRRAVISVKVGNSIFKLDLPPLLKSFGSTGIFVQRNYYEPLLQFCDRLLRPGDVAIDLGANQGIYACAFAALVGQEGRVIACEPQPYATEALRNNLKLNGFAHVAVEQAAVSDHDGEAMLDLSHGATLASIVHDMGGRKSIKVPTVSLRTLAEKFRLSRLDLIKMDIEGAEYHALEGGRELIDRFRPVIVMEGSCRDAHWGKLSRFMAERGYRAHLFGRGGRFERIYEIGDAHPCIVYF